MFIDYHKIVVCFIYFSVIVTRIYRIYITYICRTYRVLLKNKVFYPNNQRVYPICIIYKHNSHVSTICFVSAHMDI